MKNARHQQKKPMTSATNTLDHNEFHALVRAFALRGHTLIRTNAGLIAWRWNLAKPLADLDEARDFLQKIGGRL